jgi:hypothetical protein
MGSSYIICKTPGSFGMNQNLFQFGHHDQHDHFLFIETGMENNKSPYLPTSAHEPCIHAKHKDI